MKTYQDLYDFARNNGLIKTKRLLRKFVEDGQSDDFIPGAMSSTMCRIASLAIEGKDIESNLSYSETKYGPDLYFYMWHGEKE
jgi:hypothetical protein